MSNDQIAQQQSPHLFKTPPLEQHLTKSEKITPLLFFVLAVMGSVFMYILGLNVILVVIVIIYGAVLLFGSVYPINLWFFTLGFNGAKDEFIVYELHEHGLIIRLKQREKMFIAYRDINDAVIFERPLENVTRSFNLLYWDLDSVHNRTLDTMSVIATRIDQGVMFYTKKESQWVALSPQDPQAFYDELMTRLPLKREIMKKQEAYQSAP